MKQVVFIALLILATEGSAQKMLAKEGYFKTQIFDVQQALWCKSVENATAGEQVSSAKVGQPLSFWVQLSSSKRESIEVLKSIKQPVIIKWFQLSGDGAIPEWDSFLQLNDLRLDDNQNSLSQKESALTNTGSFIYNTWTSIPSVTRSGAYIVRLVFYDNSPLMCDNGPCEYQINIER
ncbi:MAG: hypothetical protein AABY93_08415 [Bacteroidota bacterium]